MIFGGKFSMVQVTFVVNIIEYKYVQTTMEQI